MAHKDYVSRGRAPKQQPAPEKPSLPWLRIVVTLGLVGSFAFGLWSIKDKAQEAKVAEQPSVEVNEDPLPEMSPEEWDYVNTLPKYQVEIEEIEQQSSGKIYILQCAAFRQVERANELRAQIAFQGLEADVMPSDGQNGRWYRVFIGPYLTKRDAEKDRHLLRKNKVVTCKIQ